MLDALQTSILGRINSDIVTGIVLGVIFVIISYIFKRRQRSKHNKINFY